MLDSGEVYASFRQYIVDTHQVTVGLYRLEKAGDHGNWIEIDGTVGPVNQPGVFDRLKWHRLCAFGLLAIWRTQLVLLASAAVALMIRNLFSYLPIPTKDSENGAT